MSLVSIALCTYNGEKYLTEQLDTLVNQDYNQLEIIVVDDGSKDKTMNILKEYEKKYPFFKVYQNDQNLGYIKNFEKAISLCNGDFIALSDQDDIWDLRKISIMVDAIKDNLLLYHNSEFITEAGNHMNRKMTDIRNFYAGNDSRIFLLENCVSGHAILFKKELTKFFSPFDLNGFHDWWIVYIAANNGAVGFITDCLVKYRQHEAANTNILRLDRADAKKRDALLQIEKEYHRIAAFEAYPFNNHKTFKSEMLRLAKNRMESYFSFSFAFFIWRHRTKLLFIQKKSGLSKFNFTLKYAWGYCLKKRLA
jgi:glycosyltransferase involved in cell wall biosynthesis